MDLKGKLELVTDLIRTLKEEWVASEPANPDLAIYLHFFRDDKLAVSLQCEIDRDNALRAGMVGASGFCADTLTISFEGYHTELPESPLTGEPWQHQEMQYVFETVPNQQWVHEAMTTTIHERGGGFGIISQSYRIADHKVEWLDNRIHFHSAEEGTGGGHMFETLQQIMSMPTMEETIAQKVKTDQIASLISDLVEDPDARRFHIDMAAYRALTEQGLITSAVFMAEKGSQREQWLIERIGEPHVMSN